MTAQTLGDRAMLVSFSVSVWSGQKADKKVGREVAQNHQSDARMGAYYKRLIDSSALKKINAVYTQAYYENQKRTLPWLDGQGGRILSSAGYFEYAEVMRKHDRDFDAAVNEFVDNYARHIEDAKPRLGTMFNEDDYPSVKDVAKKFKMGYDIFPIPSAHDFRIDLGDEAVGQIKSEIEQRVNDGMKKAMNDVAQRVIDSVGALSEKLHGSGVGLRESTIDHINELARLMPMLNVTGDQVFVDVVSQLKSVGKDNASYLRDSYSTRQKTMKEADDILAKMKEFIA